MAEIKEILNTEKMDTYLRRYDNTGYAGMTRMDTCLRRYDKDGYAGMTKGVSTTGTN